jgi:hypothetical protein
MIVLISFSAVYTVGLGMSLFWVAASERDQSVIKARMVGRLCGLVGASLGECLNNGTRKGGLCAVSV